MASKKIISSRKRLKTQEEKEKIIANRSNNEFRLPDFMIKDAFNEFIIEKRDVKGLSKATIDGYERFLKKLDKAYSGIGGVKEVPIEMLENTELMQGIFVKSLGDVNKQTINHYMRSYRVFGNFCYEKGYLLDFKCPIKEVEPDAKEVYTKKEIEKLTRQPNRSNFLEYRDYMIILILLGTGARSETIRNIKVKDVDLEEGYITFNKLKSKKVIRIGLEKRLHRELKTYIAKLKEIERINSIDIEYLFCNQYGEQLKRNGLYRAVSHYNKERGVEKTSLHLFRHTFAKDWITSSGDIVTLAKVLNHNTLEMVQRYSNLYSNDIKEEIEEHSLLSHIERKGGKTIK